LLGFNITRNFNTPFFAQNIADFWRRWHISLTTWLTDYVFTPLNIYFRNYGKTGTIMAILINFTLIGLWHGASWTYVFFGFLHGCYFIPLILRSSMNKKEKPNDSNRHLSLISLFNMAATFLLVMFTFIIFRADSILQATDYFSRLFSTSLFSIPPITEKINTAVVLVSIVLLFGAEWRQRDKQHVLQIDFIKAFPTRALIYFGLIVLIITFSPTKGADFIYFKF
jgi:alginate O-acetyltransferase complex protein AlgI